MWVNCDVDVAYIDDFRDAVDDGVYDEAVACNVCDKLVAEIDDGVVVEPLVFL